MKCDKCKLKMNKVGKHSECECGAECICCTAERLCVTSGSEMESKQYEYQFDKKLKHKANESKKATNPNVSGIHEQSQKGHEAMMCHSTMTYDMEKDMKIKFWVSLLLTIPIFLYSPMAIHLLKIKLPSPIAVNWFLFILTTIVVFWPGWIFLSGSYYSLKEKKLNMSVLIATGVSAAYFFSAVLMFIGSDESFFEAAAMLVTFVLFGHWMEMKSRRGTSDSLRTLFDLVPPQAAVIREDKEILIPSAELQIDDVVVIKPGDKIPVDGTIISGESTIDESMITGESVPAYKKIGESVIGGSINKYGSVKFKVTQIGADTTLSQIIKLVEKAQNSKAPGQLIADKAAAYLVVFAIGSGIITFLAWYFFGQTTVLTALTFAISAIVIACPDALGLATPTVVAVGTGIGAKYNILIKDAATLEQTSKIQSIVMDKTGTLTKGIFAVNDLVVTPEYSEEKLLYFVGSASQSSSHPFSKAIIEEVQRRSVSLSKEVDDFEEMSGSGLKAKVDGKQVYVGTVTLLTNLGIDISSIKIEVNELLEEGKSVSLVGVDKKVIGVIAASDEIKKTSKKTIEGLKKLGIETVLITGDNKKIAERVAQEVGIDRFFAEVLPEDKADHVKKLQDNGQFVAMVGDGINDAPALAQADIGIAIGAGTDVAIETANIVLMKSDPSDILKAILLSKATVRKMKQNLFWAAIYNLSAVPLAAGVFHPSFGWSIRPEISALLMSLSSIFVAINAVLLKRIEPLLKKMD
jgi:P-type Cu2+ transporter